MCARSTVFNLSDHQREVRLFFDQDFHISGQEVGDSAYYEPERRALYHYKGQRWFLINAGRTTGGQFEAGWDQWAVGVKEIPGREGAWRDAQDSVLSKNAVAQGGVDSCGALHLRAPARGQVVGWYWIAVGADFQEVTRLNRAVRQRGAASFIERTRSYWALWIAPERDYCRQLPPALTDLHSTSLLILRTQIDNQGAILAANDYDITSFARDTYAYMWPRDGALVAAALDECGYSFVTRRFFDFCHQVITPEGYFLHKYNPDGSLASSWHGWYRRAASSSRCRKMKRRWCYGRSGGTLNTTETWSSSSRCTAGLLLAPPTGWRVTATRPTSCRCPRGICGRSGAACWPGRPPPPGRGCRPPPISPRPLASKIWPRATGGQRMKSGPGPEAQLWQPGLGRFARMVDRVSGGGWEVDDTVDASLGGLWYFGMFAATHSRIVATMQAIQKQLWVKTVVGGVARYENDPYQQVSDDRRSVPGNPWFICTLWLAQWQIARAQAADDLKPALDILNWTASHALPSGVMAEQVHPFSHAPVSVSPLTWSHATLVLTVREYLARLTSLTPPGKGL